MIKTSVIIPVYNTASYIEECIDSVYKQTQKEIEVIAVDDGSTDGSLNVLLDMKKKYPGLTVISEENHCQGYARNVGMKLAKGEYIYFLDSDDFIIEDTLETCYDYALKNNLDVVLFDALDFEDSVERTPIEPNYDDRHDIINEGQNIFSGIYFLDKYLEKTYNPCTCLVYCSANFLKKNDVWFMPEVYFEDNEFYCRIMTLAQNAMYIPKMFYRCRCRKTSTTRTKFDLRRANDHIEVVSAIADQKLLNDGKGWYIIRKIALKLLQYVTAVCYDNNLYIEDEKLSEMILKTWIKICGCNIEENENIEDIIYISRICDILPASSLCDEKRRIHKRKKQLMIQILKKLPLQRKGVRIAIYGCGKYTERFLDFFEEEIGLFYADIIFLDSYVSGSEDVRYRGYSVYPISEIMKKRIDYIFISSQLYEEEMKNTLQKYYGNTFNAVMLYGDLHIEV